MQNKLLSRMNKGKKYGIYHTNDNAHIVHTKCKRQEVVTND